MATLIKKAETVKQTRTFSTGETVTFQVQVPLQNIGTTYEDRTGVIVKVNRKTIDVVENKYGNTWRVNMDEVK
jgi:hypothetical protein